MGGSTILLLLSNTLDFRLHVLSQHTYAYIHVYLYLYIYSTHPPPNYSLRLGGLDLLGKKELGGEGAGQGGLQDHVCLCMCAFGLGVVYIGK